MHLSTSLCNLLRHERAYKFRFYPSTEQIQLLAHTFGCVRFVYNFILNWRTDAFRQRKEKVSYAQASARLTILKRTPEFAWLNDVSFVPLQQCLRHQQTAFKNFFEGRTSYPAFKSKRHKQVAELTASAFRYREGHLYIAKSKTPLNIRWSRKLPSSPSTVTVSKDSAGRYFVSCLCEVQPEPLPVTSSIVGIDVGLTRLLVTDSGFKADNPRNTAKNAKRLALLQRRLSRKQLGSKNRTKARQKVARLHAKIADCRLDNLHKLSRTLINENQVVCVESLSVKNMMRNPQLAKSIADAGWSELIRQLRYKSEWAGRRLIAVDPFFPSSKRCSCCGYTMQVLPLNIRFWLCPKCQSHHDRDINAARNIKAAGLAVLAHGATVNPQVA
ncbi:transposase [Serratia sp. S119]|uniref:RNA-guided endonuclease InsQ/TnpB family protein n=1 Tax=Serratia sp. S119 TaxID=1118230 RepID=UPI001FEE1162|nr:transposase [Serratia sp. S119]